jgi:hypothetical protein
LASCQAAADPAADSAAIHHLLGEYTQAVDTVDLKLLAQIWSHSPDVSFIYPLGEEHGCRAALELRISCLYSSTLVRDLTALTGSVSEIP